MTIPFTLFPLQERNLNRRRAESKLVIDVVAKDNHPPELAVSATEGFIDENSALGTLVLDKGGNPIRFTVSDRDQVRNIPILKTGGVNVDPYWIRLTDKGWMDMMGSQHARRKLED